jgi:DNA-binding Lrp family transcriptional regulator
MAQALVPVRLQPVRLDQSSNFMQTIKEEIAKVGGVKEIKGVFGRYDFVAIVETRALQELGTVVTDTTRNIKEVAETETLVAGFWETMHVGCLSWLLHTYWQR